MEPRPSLIQSSLIQPSLIMLQFLEWVAARPRRREDVLDAWQSSCPRFPVWEDARAEGFVHQRGGEQGEHRVELTALGRRALERAQSTPSESTPGESTPNQSARDRSPCPKRTTRTVKARQVREPAVAG